jgi:hypothetical protein
VKRLFIVALFLEAGFVLLVVPWSGFWDRNYFAQALPAVQAVLSSNYLRGAVSGLGLVNIYVGLAELVSAITAAPPSPPSLTSSINSRD